MRLSIALKTLGFALKCLSIALKTLEFALKCLSIALKTLRFALKCLSIAHDVLVFILFVDAYFFGDLRFSKSFCFVFLSSIRFEKQC